MTPAPSKIIVTNDGVTAPYYVSKQNDHLFSLNAELPASVSVEYIDIHGLNGTIEQSDWPPASNIESVAIVDGNLRVTGSSAWLPAPFNLNFEVKLDEDFYEFYVRFV